MGKIEMPLRMEQEQFAVFVDEAKPIGVTPLNYIRWILGLPIEKGPYTIMPPDIPEKYKEPRRVARKAKMERKATPEKSGKRSG